MQNADGGFPVDCEQLSLRVSPPFDSLLQTHRAISARLDSKTPKHFVVRQIAPGTAGPVEFVARFFRDLLCFVRCRRHRLCDRIDHGFQQVDDGRKLCALQLSDQFDRVLFLAASITITIWL